MAYFKAIVGISLLIVLHELGHYLVARLCGMRVLRFSVGFGPSLIKRRIGETEWQIAAVPLGGYVQIDGMGPATEQDGPPDARTFRSKPVWQRVAVIAAGPAMNWILAAVFITVVGVTVGFSSYDDNSTVIGELPPTQPAAQAGFKVGDRIISINDEKIDTWNAVIVAVSTRPETPIIFEIERDKKRLGITITPKRRGKRGRVGMGQVRVITRVGPWEGIVAGVGHAWRTTTRQAGMMWGMLRGSQEGELSGIGEIVKMAAAQAARGIEMLLQFLAWLSIGLFLLNLVPLPALDGGRLVFLIVEGVRGRPINQRVEGMVHGIGFLVLMALIIAVTLRDCFR